MRTRLRVQWLQRERANKRANWQHRASRRIANLASRVFVEKLNTRGMTRSARGTVDNPGMNVKAESGLDRKILGTGWHGIKENPPTNARWWKSILPLRHRPATIVDGWTRPPARRRLNTRAWPAATRTMRT